MDALHDQLPLTHTDNEIWNPNAAANWSILFTPVFGSYLHMLNWKVLGEQDLALRAKKWFQTSVGVVLSTLLLSLAFPGNSDVDLLIKVIAVGYLFTWYFASARPQAKYVEKRYGNNYVHRRWTKALLCGVAITVIYVASVTVLGYVVGMARAIASAT